MSDCTADVVDAVSDSLKACNLEDDDTVLVTRSAEWPLPSWLSGACELFHVESNNTLLVRCEDGSLVMCDAGMEAFKPTSVAKYNPKAKVLYDRQNGTLVFADERNVCFRKENCGSFLIKEALTLHSEGMIRLELPVEEALKLIEEEAYGEESVVEKRPALAALISKLDVLVTNVPNDMQHSVVVLVDGPELLSELRPIEGVVEGQSEVPDEWSSNAWPQITALAERVRLLLNPEHPYNLEYAPEWKGIDKEVMVSEAARRLTFEHWPHMNYRWALPCQMAEAGFFHQPNKAGDDRVLCFACLVCLVCWEPSDEPWSEHERHSQTCRFIRNNSNPNVPLSVTMSALSPFPHEIGMSEESSLIISSSSNSQWMGLASLASNTVHMWRCDRVVHPKQYFLIDVHDSLLASKTGFILTDFPLTRQLINFTAQPRRGVRVTWSDWNDEPVESGSAECAPKTTLNLQEYLQKYGSLNDSPVKPSTASTSESSTDESTINTAQSTSSSYAGEMLITAMCTVGNSHMMEASSIGAVANCPALTGRPSMIVSIGLDSSRLLKAQTDSQQEQQQQTQQQQHSGGSSEVCALNCVNSVCGVDATPRIVTGSIDSANDKRQTDSDCTSHTNNTSNITKQYHPFILVYHMSEQSDSQADSALAQTRTDDLKADEDMWPIPMSGWISNSTIPLKQQANTVAEGVKVTKQHVGGSGNGSFHPDMMVEETDLAEAMMLIEAENDVPTWSPNEQQQYDPTCDQTIMEEEWETVVKSKMEDKTCSDFIAVNYDPTPANVELVQCLRLPAELNDPSFRVTSLVASTNGLYLMAAVNRVPGTTGHIQSALLVYHFVFTPYVTLVPEEPCKIYLDKEHRIEQLVVLNNDSMGGGASPSADQLEGTDLMDSIIIRSPEGDVFVLDLTKNERVRMCEEKAKHIAPMDNGKCAVITNTGKLLVLQVEHACSRRVGDEIDEEATVAALLSGGPSSSTPPTSSASSSAVSVSDKMEIYAMQPLSCGVMRKLWDLTRSDGGSSLLTGPPTAQTYSSSSSGFQVVPPLSWTEIQLPQRLRKNPQHWLRGDRSTRSWILQQEPYGLPDVQAFEIHLQGGVQMSHANVRFTFHTTCIGCPDVKVSVWRRRFTADTASTKWVGPTVRPGVKPDFVELKDQCDVMAGPLLLADYVDVGGNSSLLQLPGRIFQSTSHHSAHSKASKMQTFYLVLESMSDMSFEQIVAAHKMRDREKAAVQEACSSKSRNLRRREGGGYVKTLELKSSKKSHSKDLPPIGSGRGSVHSHSSQQQNPFAPTQPRKRLEWIEEISITLLKTKRALERNERIQRRMMIETHDLHRRLVQLATGSLSRQTAGSSSSSQVQTNGMRMLMEHRALDVIMWLLDNWTVSNNAQSIVGVTNVLISEMELLIENGFIYARRSIAHKWCSLIMHVLHVVKSVDMDRHCDLLEAVIKCMKGAIAKCYLIDNAGALHWLITLTFAVTQMSMSLAGTPKCSQMVDSLLAVCANTLTEIGRAWHKMWTESVHEKLATTYGLCGLPLELMMYEWPSPMLTLWARATTPNNPHVTLSNSVVLPMPIPLNGNTTVKYPWASPGTQTTHVMPKHGLAPGSSLAAASMVGKSSSNHVLTMEAVSVSAFMNAAAAQDEIDWMDVYNLMLGDAQDTTTKPANDGGLMNSIVPPPGTGYTLSSRFGMRTDDANNGRDAKRRMFLSPTQMSGLLEVEPLTFSCCVASEHVKVENIDTGVISAVNSSSSPVGHPTSKGPVMMKSAPATAIFPATSLATSSPAPESDLDSFLKVNLQNLSARMKKIAMEVNEQCAKDQSTSSETGMPPTSGDTTQGSTTQDSSASTFGVPTTPKTTPFMTPTPLSPSHLSPINSETNLTILPEVDELKSEELNGNGNGVLNESARMANATLTPAITVVPCDLLQPPPIQVLSIDRMAAGARKFVVLDFGVPVLLTDVLIPSCAELSSVYMDVWLLGETVDGQRLISSTHISAKSIALQDIAPTMLIRFVKLTYVGRPMFNAPCRIPIGSFFGHRFFSPWQPYACPPMATQLASFPTLPHHYQQAPAVNVEQVRQLCEDLRCRHQLASNELVTLVREEADEGDVKKVYKECMQLRAQWNLVRGVVQRLQADQAPAGVQERRLTVEKTGWKDCGSEQLHVVAEQLFGLLTQCVHLLDLRSAAEFCAMVAVEPNTSPVAFFQTLQSCNWVQYSGASSTFDEVPPHHLLTLDMAIHHFMSFCTSAMPKLQVACAVWLFHHGAEMPWWPKFFPTLLTHLFSSPMKKGDQKVLMLLSFLCNHTVKSTSSQAAVMQELLVFIDAILKRSYPTECGAASKPLATNLLSCTIMLTTTAFDVVLGGKRKLDRWAFAAGEFSFGATHASTLAPSSSSADRLGDYFKMPKKAMAITAPDMDMSSQLTATELHNKMQSLWSQHLQHLNAMEAMKASMRGLNKSAKTMDEKPPHNKHELKLKPNFLKSKFSELCAHGVPGIPPQDSVLLSTNEPNLPSTSSSSAAATPDDIANSVLMASTPKKIITTVETKSESKPPLTTTQPEDQPQASDEKQPVKEKTSRDSVKQVEAKFAKKLEEIDEKQPPDVSGSKIEELVKWANRSSSTPSRSRSSRARQYNIRMKLPLDVCESVAMSLIRALCEHTDEMPYGGNVFMCKLIARICTNASHHTIPLAAVIDGHLAQLIQIGLNGRNTVAMRSAVLSLLQDVIESEARSFAKNAASAKSEGGATTTNVVPTSIFEGISSSFLEQFCRKLVGVDYTVLAEQALHRSTDSTDTEEQKSTGATAASSALPFAFAFMKKSPTQFSVANYDTAPSQDQLDALIEQAMALIGPVELPSCTVNMSTRQIILRYLCREVIVSKLEKNEPFSNVFRWIDGVRYGEARVAIVSENAVPYAVKLCSPSLPKDSFPVSDEKTTISVSALTACLRTEHAIYTALSSSAKSKDGSECSTIRVASAGSSSPSASVSPTNVETENNLDDLVVNAGMIDSGDLQAIKALDTFADNMSGHITKDATSVLVSGELQEEVGSDHVQEDGHVQEEKDASSSNDHKMKGDGNCQSVSNSSEKLAKQMLMDHIMISFQIQARSISEEVMVQPCSLNIDERAECQLGLRPYIRCLATDSLADILLRHSHRHLAPWRKRTVSRPRAPESVAMRAQMGSTLPMAMEAISHLIKRIPADSSVEYVVVLLSFFNDFQEGVNFPESVRRMMQEVALYPAFPNEGIEAVLEFTAVCNRPTEQMWTLILRLFSSLCSANDAASKHLIMSSRFSVFLSRVMRSGINRFSESTMMGPAMTNAFGDLVHKLHASTAHSAFGAKLLSILSDILMRRGSFEFIPFPVEMMMSVIAAMARQPRTYIDLPSAELSKFVAAVVRVTKDLLRSDKLVPISMNDGNRADVCFQSVNMSDVDELTDGEPEGDTIMDIDDEQMYKPYWSVSGLPLSRNDVYESGSQTRNYEEMVVNMLHEVLGYCSENKTLVADVIWQYPNAVEDLLKVLSACSFCDRDYDAMFEERKFLNGWKPVSVADCALRLLLLFTDLAGDQLEHMVGLTVECLKRSVTAFLPPGVPKLSKPVTFSVVYMLLNPQNQRVFVQFGGHLVVANEMMSCIAASIGDTSASENASMVRQLASMSSQISLGYEYPVVPRRPQDVKYEGFHNYAPFCTITSSSPMAHQLSTLLAAAPAHRRARTANWSYHFYPGEEWLELTLTLPYQIMLYEVHIRPHPPTLNTGPSAVQLEVCSDPTISTWTLLAPKMSTLGFSKIRIPTDAFPYPVSAIRIYLRRAPDSTNLGLSQIMVLGMSSLQSLSVPQAVSTDFRQWLAIQDRLCCVEDTSIWQYAPHLPRCLVILFLGRPLPTGIYRRISALLARIDNAKAKPETVVELILSYIAQGNYVAPKSLSWLPEVMFTLCCKACEETDTPLHIIHQIQVFRQRQLLAGIDRMLSVKHRLPHDDQEAIAALMWSASCATWSNVSDDSMHFDTVAICTEVGSRLIARLCNVASNQHSWWRSTMCDAASWLLCSLIRCAPAHLNYALHCLGIVSVSKGIPTPEALSVIGKMCQSGTAVRSLLKLNALQYWVDEAIAFCQFGQFTQLTQLASLVECLRLLCSIEDVVTYLDSAQGSALFKPLITFVANVSSMILPVTVTSRDVNLDNATVGLVCRCISMGGGHRERISSILCELLKHERTLNGAVQQMVLKCVLDDETVPVKLVDEKAPSFMYSANYKVRMVHPLFGCTRREQVTTASLYATFKDLLPPCVLSANIVGRKVAAKFGRDVGDNSRASMGVEAATGGSEGLTKEAESKKLLVTYLMCDKYSKRRPVSGDWYLGPFINALRSLQIANRSSMPSSVVGTEREASLDDVQMSSEDQEANFTDGYFSLMLKIDTSTVDELKRAAELEISPFESPPTQSLNISTLQYFARAGGLAILAQHLQLYQPSTTIATSVVNTRGRGTGGGGGSMPKEPASMNGWLNNYVMQPFMSEPNGYIPVYFPVPDQVEEEQSTSSVNEYVPPAFAEDANMSYEHEFEFIDMPHLDFVHKFYPPVTVANQAAAPLYTTVMPNNAQKMTAPRMPPHSNYALSTALSPHVVIAFSVLLRLDGYAESLVTYDRVRSKQLLRLAMGVSSSHQDSLTRSSNNQSTNAHTKNGEEADNDSDTLALLPFIVLERLFRMQHPDTPSGRALRNAAIQYGVLDILLVCLAHYSHQKHKAEPIRPPSLLPAPESVKLTEHLLRASAQHEALRAEAAHSSNGNGYDDRVTMNYAVGGGTGVHSQPHSNFWAKGTGFGSGTTQQQWNVDAHVMKRKLDEETVTHLLRVLASYIFPSPNWRRNRTSRSRRSTATSECSSMVDSCSSFFNSISSASVVRSQSRTVSISSPTSEVVCDEWNLDAPIVELLSRSCLLPTIYAYLRNDSVLDISRHVEVYESVVYLVAALARCPSKQQDQRQDALAVLLSQCESDVSLLAMLHKLHGYILAYLSKLYTEAAPQQQLSTLLTNALGQDSEKTIEDNNAGSMADGTAPKGSEEGLTRLSHIIMRTCTFVSRRVGADTTKTENSAKPILTVDEKYIEVMKPLQFQSIAFFIDSAHIPYHYSSSLGVVGMSASLGKRTRRLAQEVVTLSNSLPLTASSSVFVRCAEERLDVMKVLITGPSETPYMNGCFEFDVWFPSDYPNSPMHVNMETTGNHTVRFNPNLYNDGKVCLSVLNTWHGRPEERWNPGTSSFLQVIVSMQSLILVSEPYFNEPGYERSKCTQAGQQASRDYDANIRQATVRWAMLEQLRHPPVAFKDVLIRHFWLKREEIMCQVSEWIRETESQVEEQRGTSRTLQAHLSSLKRHFAALQEEFARMERPSDIEQEGANINTGTGADSQTATARQQPQHTITAHLSSMKVLKL